MKLNKKALDEYIRITRKYYRTGDADILAHKGEIQESLNIYFGYHDSLSNIIDAMCHQRGRKFTNKEIYDVVTLLGYEIEVVEE